MMIPLRLLLKRAITFAEPMTCVQDRRAQGFGGRFEIGSYTVYHVKQADLDAMLSEKTLYPGQRIDLETDNQPAAGLRHQDIGLIDVSHAAVNNADVDFR